MIEIEAARRNMLDALTVWDEASAEQWARCDRDRWQWMTDEINRRAGKPRPGVSWLSNPYT